MTTTDEVDATKALAARLADWGVEGAPEKAKQYIADLVAHGWRVAAPERVLRRPPMKSEECRTHAGEYHDFCRACVADRKAAADEQARESGERWTPERIRESLHGGGVPT